MISVTSPLTFGNLLVATNAWISLSSQAAAVSVSSNATIEAGGGIIADGAGYAGAKDPEPGRSDPYAYTGGGGGYGGLRRDGGAGDEPVSTAYGGAALWVGHGAHGLGEWRRQLFGSRPSGGAGGGAIRLNVTGR